MSERLANYFVGYLFDQYPGARHVRRVASWIGFVLKAIERSGAEYQRSHLRQLVFNYDGHRYKVRYNHRAGNRGGIDIVESHAGRGAPDGATIATITSLDDAERFYRVGLERTLRQRRT